MNVVYNEMVQKKQALDKLEKQGKRKYEYDSDEDVEVKIWM
jgi:splicing factor 4